MSFISIGSLFRLALPMVLTYLGTLSMGFVDILLVGNINAAAIGAVGVGSCLFSWFLVFGLGLSSGMEYLVSHSFGERNHKLQGEYLVQGVLLLLLISVPLTVLMLFISCHLELLGVNPIVLMYAKNYSIILSFSLLSAFLFNVFRLYLSALRVVCPAMMMLVVGNVSNALIGYILVLGRWGAPRLEAEGAAWATLVSRLLMMFGLGVYLFVWDRKNGNLLFRTPFRYHADRMRELIRIGMPAALQMVFEVGIFAFTTTLIARLTADELAAHQIVLNVASLTFMVPLGVSSATAILVGQALGKKDRVTAVQVGWQGFALGVGFMAVSASLFLCFSHPILNFFTHDAAVIALGKEILFIAALFQLSDGIQVVGTGALRGLGETHTSMIFNFCGHWLIGLPIGVSLCFLGGWGLKGLWVGLSLGLTAVAAAVLLRWIFRAQNILRGQTLNEC